MVIKKCIISYATPNTVSETANVFSLQVVCYVKFKVMGRETLPQTNSMALRPEHVCCYAKIAHAHLKFFVIKIVLLNHIFSHKRCTVLT